MSVKMAKQVCQVLSILTNPYLFVKLFDFSCTTTYMSLDPYEFSKQNVFIGSKMCFLSNIFPAQPMWFSKRKAQRCGEHATPSFWQSWFTDKDVTFHMFWTYEVKTIAIASYSNLRICSLKFVLKSVMHSEVFCSLS